MTKRKWEEESEVLQPNAPVAEGLAIPASQFVGDQEELVPVGQVIPEERSQDTTEDPESATSAAKRGELGPFWELLAQAGYTIW